MKSDENLPVRALTSIKQAKNYGAGDMPTIGLNFRASLAGNLRTLSLAGMLVSAILVPRSEVFAQAGALVNLTGSNDAQSDMARSVDWTCPDLVGNLPNNTDDQNELLGVCTNMIVDYFILNPEPGNGVFNFLDSNGDGVLTSADENIQAFPGFGLDEQGLNNALQSMAGEELQAAQSRLAEVRDVQSQTIFSRLAAIRAGQTGGGINLAGLNLEVGEAKHSLYDLALLDADQYEIIPAAWLNDETWSRLGIFLSGGLKVGDKEDTNQSDGFDFSSLSITAGMDYRLTDDFVVGGAFGFSQFDADVDETERSQGGQELSSDGYVISAFASYSLDSGFFADGAASFGQDDYDSTRRIVIPSTTSAAGIDSTAEGDFEGTHYSLTANLGYELAYQGFAITPTAKLDYVNADFDGFTEAGAGGLNLSFNDFDLESLRSHLGVEAAFPISTDQGVLVPSVRAEYVHEFENENDGAQVVFNNALATTARAVYNISSEGVDEDYGIIGASLTAVGEGGMSAFIDYSTVVALDNFDVHQINAGFRWEF